MPEVSIIVPNYNHARFFLQRVDSIFNQTYQDFEVILLDDCSTDNSYKQSGSDFIPFLSIIDVIMFNDKDTIPGYLKEYDLL